LQQFGIFIYRLNITKKRIFPIVIIERNLQVSHNNSIFSPQVEYKKLKLFATL
jgi:hypothetical protein